MKKNKFSEFEKIAAQLVAIVGKAFDADKLTHYEAIGVFESAKHIYITVQDQRFNEDTSD